ncbi:hypothetical protein KM043_004120 [Ampulex compressa]|nr:hypothetical protein KM043_004120 [Ampulex compressa]
MCEKCLGFIDPPIAWLVLLLQKCAPKITGDCVGSSLSTIISPIAESQRDALPAYLPIITDSIAIHRIPALPRCRLIVNACRVKRHC